MLSVLRYPGRAHSCLQYLQQFLALQEQRAVQQIQLLAMMQQEQQSFRLQLDSLVPQRGNAGGGGNNGVMTGMLGTPRGNAGLSLNGAGGMNGLNGAASSMLGVGGLQGNLNLAFQQQQVAAAAHQAAQQQQQLMNAANLLSRGMRRDNSATSNGLRGLGGGGANSNDLLSSLANATNNSNGGGNVLSLPNMTAMNNGGMSRGPTLQNQQQQMQQQQLQSLQQLAAAAIVDLGSSASATNNAIGNAANSLLNGSSSGSVTTPSSSSTGNTTQSDNSGNGFGKSSLVNEAMVTNILGKRIFLIIDNEMLGLPAYASSTSSTELKLIGFYSDDSGNPTVETDEFGWRFRPIQKIDAFQDAERAANLSKLIVDAWKEPSNRQDGLCFDVFAYENNLTAMKRSISLILQELEENEGKLIALCDSCLFRSPSDRPFFLFTVSNVHFLSA